jgi:hypothetical protein
VRERTHIHPGTAGPYRPLSRIQDRFDPVDASTTHKSFRTFERNGRAGLPRIVRWRFMTTLLETLRARKNFRRSSRRPPSRLKARSLPIRPRRERKRSRLRYAMATSRTRQYPSFAIVTWPRMSTAATTSSSWGASSYPKSNSKLKPASCELAVTPQIPARSPFRIASDLRRSVKKNYFLLMVHIREVHLIWRG